MVLFFFFIAYLFLFSYYFFILGTSFGIVVDGQIQLETEEPDENKIQKFTNCRELNEAVSQRVFYFILLYFTLFYYFIYKYVIFIRL